MVCLTNCMFFFFRLTSCVSKTAETEAASKGIIILHFICMSIASKIASYHTFIYLFICWFQTLYVNHTSNITRSTNHILFFNHNNLSVTLNLWSWKKMIKKKTSHIEQLMMELNYKYVILKIMKC